jgi:hypothetical protein
VVETASRTKGGKGDEKGRRGRQRQLKDR